MSGYFSRIRMRDEHGLSPALAKHLSEGYGLHQSLWQLFSVHGNEARDFLYRRVDGPGTPTYYAVSRRPPKTDHPLWAVEIKPYAPRVEVDSTFAFALRVNATRSTRDPETGREHRHDVVQHAKRSGPSSSPVEVMQEAGWDWLSERAIRSGFSLIQLRVDGHCSHRLLARGKPPIQFTTLDLEGILQVTDSIRFKQTLFLGLGRSKGFGCGLLLIRHA